MKIFANKYVPYALAVVIAALGALSWHGLPTVLLMVALIYLGLVMILTSLVGKLERRLRKSER